MWIVVSVAAVPELAEAAPDDIEDIADDVPADDAPPEPPQAAVASTSAQAGAASSTCRIRRPRWVLGVCVMSGPFGRCGVAGTGTAPDVSSGVVPGSLVTGPAAEDVGGDLVGEIGPPLAVGAEVHRQRGGVDGEDLGVLQDDGDAGGGADRALPEPVEGLGRGQPRPVRVERGGGRRVG